MSLLSRVTAKARRLFRSDAREDVSVPGFGTTPDPGFGGGNMFRQWIGIYQLIDKLARARGGNISERPADDRMLYIARGLMRYNPYAQGMIGALRNHTLGSRGFKHTPTGPGRKLIGPWLERWKANVDWWQWEREIYQRVHIEGESVTRFFVDDDYIELRPIEPEWIVARDGTQQWTFGFYNEPDDVHDITALNEAREGAGEVVDAAFWYHVKSKLTVRAEKRGISDFLAVAQLLDDSFKTWRNFLQSEAVRQSVIYFAKQAAGVTTQDLEQAIASEADYGPPVSGTAQRRGEALSMNYGAAVEYIQDGTEMLAVPAASAQGTMTGVNAGLLAAGRAYHIPLVLMSGDMSANNTLDFGDESPFGTTVKDEQNWFSRHVRNIMWRAVEFAVDEGVLPVSVLYDGTDIEVAAERRQSANSLDNTNRAKTLYDDGVISARERATMEGVDYDEQQAQRKREEAENPAPVEEVEDDDMPDPVAEDVTVTVHRNGKTFTQHRKSGKGKQNVTKKKVAKGAAKKSALAPAHEQLATAPLDTEHVPKGLIGKMKVAAKAVWFKANVAMMKLSRPALVIGSLLGEVFDTPDDMKKFAYNPGNGVAGHNTNDFVQSSMNDAFGIGLSGHMVAGIVAKVLAKVITHAKKKLNGAKPAAAESADAGVMEFAEFLSNTYAHTMKELGVDGDVPTTEEIAESLSQLRSDAAESTDASGHEHAADGKFGSGGGGGKKANSFSAAKKAIKATKDPVAKDFIESALFNATKGDEKDLAMQLASVWMHAKSNGHEGAAAEIEKVLASTEATIEGPDVGETVTHSGKFYYAPPGIGNGDKVVVVRQPVVHSDGTVLVKGQVKPR